MPKDKILHAIAGFIITLLMGYIFDIIVGIVSGVLAGLGKEMLDEIRFMYGKHPVGWDNRDLFFTVAGTIIAGGLLVVLL